MIIMKLHLESSIVEGTPEELAKYTELLESGNKYNQLFSFGHVHQPDEDTLKSLIGSLKGPDSYTTDSTEIPTEEDVEVDPEEAEGLLGYRYWYLEGININSFYVLKATANYFEDSKGKRYTYQAVSERVKPIDREDACKRFERAKDNDKLLRYYPTVDLFTHR